MSGYTVITSDYLEHSRRDSIPNRFYFSHISNPTVTNGKIEFNVAFVYGVKKSNGTVGGRVIYTPNVYFIYDTGNRPSKEQLAKEIKPAITKMALNYSTPVSKEESDRAIDEAYKWVQRAPFSNTPISSKPFQTVKDEIRHSDDLDIIDVSDNHFKDHASYALAHSLFTEVYDMDDYLEHHGILGMRWGVRRYQNEDGTLTEAGRKRYINQKYKQSRTTFEKELNAKLEGKSKEERTKIIRQESRDLAEAAANRANTNTKRMIGTTAIGGTAGGVAGGLLAGPLGAVFGAYAASVVTAVGSSLAIALGEQFLYSERNRAKDNLLNMKYDEINIDEETKRRLNL